MTDEAPRSASTLRTGPGAPAFNPGAPGTMELLASDPDEWARLVRIVFYHSTALRHADRELPEIVRQFRRGDQDASIRSAHHLVNVIRHHFTNYHDLTASIVDAHGYGRAQNAVDILRHRVLRATAYGFPPLAPFCSSQANDRAPRDYELPAISP